MIEIEQIKLFRSLVHGREDAFAIRWEKGNKSGYMPSYQFDPYHYKIHKSKGGTLANYQDKTLQPLRDEQIKRHLLGESQIFFWNQDSINSNPTFYGKYYLSRTRRNFKKQNG